ncbi:MAG: precorrin-2 C(20)-methyltransferase [Acidimicrobiia bacterium]
MTTGRCYGVGVGPGDPELMTVKAVRVIEHCGVIAYFSAARRESNARRVAQGHVRPHHTEMRFVYPVTTEAVVPDRYETLLADLYDESAKRLAEVLDEGVDVAVLCEGDPFFFGSYMYLHTRLWDRYPTAVVPGVSSALAGAAVVGAPLASRNEVFTVLSGVLDVDELAARIAAADAVVVMKVGRNLERVRDAVRRAGALERAQYVEWATLPNERVLPLTDADASTAPYFSMVVIPGVAAARR